jgi:hypothetical protein
MSAHFSTPRREIAWQSFDNLQRYWNDPAFVAQANAEAKRCHDASMAKMDAGIARYRAKREQSA